MGNNMNAIKEFFASFFLLDLIKGLALTGRYLFARKITTQFSEAPPLPPRFRGLHALRRYPNGEKRGDLYFTKEMLLAIGDRYETEIEAARTANAPYR